MSRGFIQYTFKGMCMSKMSATVVHQGESELVAVRDEDEQVVCFVLENDMWLLRGTTTSVNPLYGTAFIKCAD